MKTIKNNWMLTGLGAAALTLASIGGIAAATSSASATVTTPTSNVGGAVEDGSQDGEVADDRGSEAPDQETADDQNELDGETDDDSPVTPSP